MDVKQSKAGSSTAWEQADVELRRDLVGQFLKDKRLAAGVTQAEIARVLRYSSAQFISNWERGVALPPLDVLPRLIELLAIRPDEIIEVLSRYQTLVADRQRQRLVAMFRSGSRRA
jgi:transcriptional regulator with XRE-family HTH domain